MKYNKSRTIDKCLIKLN